MYEDLILPLRRSLRGKIQAKTITYQGQSVSSVAQSCPNLYDPMNRSMPGFPVHHQLPELTQTHVHWVGDVIQPSFPLSSPSPPAFNLSQHQGLFQWVSSSHQVDKVLEFQLQHQSFQWIFRTDFLWMDWLDLLAVQGTLKRLLKHHSLKASILWHSAFFIVHLLHPCLTLAGPKAGVTLTAGSFTLSGIWDKWAKRGYHLLLSA